jgi:hypothetical protein
MFVLADGAVDAHLMLKPTDCIYCFEMAIHFLRLLTVTS